MQNTINLLFGVAILSTCVVNFIQSNSIESLEQHKTSPTPLYVPQTVRCDDVIRYEDGALVCEINIQAEYQEIKTI